MFHFRKSPRTLFPPRWCWTWNRADFLSFAFEDPLNPYCLGSWPRPYHFLGFSALLRCCCALGKIFALHSQCTVVTDWCTIKWKTWSTLSRCKILALLKHRYLECTSVVVIALDSALVGSWRRSLLGMLHSCYHLTPAPPPTGSSLSFPQACTRHHPWDRYLDVCHEEKDTVNIQIPQKPWEALSACRTTRDQYPTMQNTHKHRVLKNNSLMAMLLFNQLLSSFWCCWYDDDMFCLSGVI